MYDEIIPETLPENVKLEAIVLIYDKKIVLIRAKELDIGNKKNYARSLLIMIKDELITTNYADTKLLLSELKLFDRGNKQNKFTTLEKKDGDINLKLTLSNSHIYISKAEALTICGIYEESKIGISIQRLMVKELKFTADSLTSYLHESKLLDKIGN
jgi:hypothetical protein